MARRFLAALCLVLIGGSALAQNAAPVVTVPLSAITVNTGSSTVTVGGTFQQGAAAGIRKSIDFQNRSGNADACYLYFGTTAAANTAGTGKAIKVADGQEYLRSTGSIPADAVQVTCATTADAFYLAVQ